MKIIKGDLVKLAKEGEFDAIIHGCNCFHVMGAGIAEQIRNEWPMVYKVDVDYSDKGDFMKLGTYTHCRQKISKQPDTHDNKDYKWLHIYNAYTQFRYGIGSGPYNPDVLVDYNAVRNVFALIIASLPKKIPMKIGIPKIGAGLAGGDWDYIAPCLEAKFAKTIHELTLVEYVPDGTQWTRVL